MENKPKVSVIIPMYNVELYIEKCLESLKNQTLEDLEVILVNDGTKDDSGKICLEYIEKNNLFDKFHYYIKENGGLSDARNYGLKYANGEYICFLDSDDYVEKNTYELLYNAAKKNNSIMVECEFFYEYDSMKNKVQKLNKKYNSINEYMVYSSVVAWNKLINKEWLDNQKIEFLKGYQYEDVNFFFKLCMRIGDIKKISTINTPLIHYVQRNTSITNRTTSRIVEIVGIYEDIINDAKNIGKYNIYFYEIEYKVVRNLYCAFYRKLRNMENKQEKENIFEKYEEIIEKYFYNWKKNKYLRVLNLNNIYLRIVNKKILYFFIKF